MRIVVLGVQEFIRGELCGRTRAFDEHWQASPAIESANAKPRRFD
jgi:hypothetical protein